MKETDNIQELEEIKNERGLNRFFYKQKDKAFAFIRRMHPFQECDCNDIYSRAIITLWEKTQKEDFQLTSRLETFFLGICNNKAREFLRGENTLQIQLEENNTDEEYKDNKIEYLAGMDAGNDSDLEDFVLNLPYPCNKLLWNFYYFGNSLKEIAGELEYTYDRARKEICVCREKFADNYPH